MNYARLIKCGIAAFIALTIFGAGAAAAWLTMWSPRPHTLSDPPSVTTTPIVEQDFSDSRAVQVLFTVHPSVTISSDLSGRVTESTCAEGAEVQSGTLVLRIDQQPVVALATSLPLWRDIALGTRGDDVRALQRELQRLGYYHGTVDGSAGSATLRSAGKLLASFGAAQVTNHTLSTAQIAWLPRATVTVASCSAPVGSRVNSGDPLETLAGELARASVISLPGDLVAGSRVLATDDVTVPVDSEGATTDPASLAKLSSTASYAQNVATGVAATDGGRTRSDSGGAEGSVQGVSANLILTDPIKIGVVPPTSVYSLVKNSGCVVADGRPYRVTVVGSQLGQTSIEFPSGSHPRMVVVNPKAGTSCT